VASESTDADRFEWMQVVHSELGPASHVERSVLTVIFLHTSQRRQSAWPGQDTIAKRCKLSTRHVKRLLAKLASLGWIRREYVRSANHGGNYAKYTPAIPANALEARDIQMSPSNGKGSDVEGDTKMSPGDKAMSPTPNSRGHFEGTRGHLPPHQGTFQGGPGDILEGPRSLHSEVTNMKSHTSEGTRLSPSGGVVEKLKTPEQIEAEERARKEAEQTALKAAEEQKRQRDVARANRVKVALKAFPTYSDNEIARVAGAMVPEVERLRKQA
jgi:hypothetical protein